MIFSFSLGQAGDAPEGRRLLTELEAASEPCAMIMDRAYEGDATKKLVSKLGFSPVAPQKSSRTELWEHDKELYKKRNPDLDPIKHKWAQAKALRKKLDCSTVENCDHKLIFPSSYSSYLNPVEKLSASLMVKIIVILDDFNALSDFGEEIFQTI
ncbi:hypothetical protein [Candidatus Electronema sp. JC]|uniref:hypothetical protein n=1 Tax=Candidatus Electronema sp. JC TaxID=3401570 RepID=UPI003B438C25